jgi:hypothetical protein
MAKGMGRDRYAIDAGLICQARDHRLHTSKRLRRFAFTAKHKRLIRPLG